MFGILGLFTTLFTAGAGTASAVKDKANEPMKDAIKTISEYNANENASYKQMVDDCCEKCIQEFIDEGRRLEDEWLFEGRGLMINEFEGKIIAERMIKKYNVHPYPGLFYNLGGSIPCSWFVRTPEQERNYQNDLNIYKKWGREMSDYSKQEYAGQTYAYCCMY